MKRITYLSVVCTLLILAGSCASAVVIDFDDLTLGTRYYLGTTFIASGVSITVETYEWDSGVWNTNPGSYAAVADWGDNVGSGNHMYPNNVNLDFDVGVASGLSLEYFESGGNCNVEINGDFRNIQSLDELDGQTVGGVEVTVTATGAFNKYGTMTLSGLVNSFAIGGQELVIDDVTLVPEPGCASILGCGMISVAGSILRRRRRM